MPRLTPAGRESSANPDGRRPSRRPAPNTYWYLQATPEQVEIFFSILWRRLLKHGIFTSETDLAQQMLAFIETYNQTAKPFKWTYTGKVREA